jgi:hypothetical protein
MREPDGHFASVRLVAVSMDAFGSHEQNFPWILSGTQVSEDIHFFLGAVLIFGRNERFVPRRIKSPTRPPPRWPTAPFSAQFSTSTLKIRTTLI